MVMKHLAIIAAVGLVGVILMVATEARNNANPIEGLLGPRATGGPNIGNIPWNPCHCDNNNMAWSSWHVNRNCERACNAYQIPNCPVGCSEY